MRSSFECRGWPHPHSVCVQRYRTLFAYVWNFQKTNSTKQELNFVILSLHSVWSRLSFICFDVQPLTQVAKRYPAADSIVFMNPNPWIMTFSKLTMILSYFAALSCHVRYLLSYHSQQFLICFGQQLCWSQIVSPGYDTSVGDQMTSFYARSVPTAGLVTAGDRIDTKFARR